MIEAGKDYVLRREDHDDVVVSVKEFVSPISGVLLLGFCYKDDPWPWAVVEDTGAVPFMLGGMGQLHELNS